MIENDLLKLGVDELIYKNKITKEIGDSLKVYVDTNTNLNFLELGYDAFDQANSTGLVFDPVTRAALNVGAAVLRFKPIKNLNGFTMIALKSKLSQITAVTYQLSKDGVQWFNIPESNIYETISDPTNTGFYLKLSYSTATEISGLYLLYK